MGTCMGTEPRPIWTEGTEVGPTAGRRGPEGGLAVGTTGPDPTEGNGCECGVGPTPWAWAGKAPKAGEPSVAMVGPTAAKAAGSGGSAVLATPRGDSFSSTGGGVAAIVSGGGGDGLGAAAWACSLAPQPKQNLYRSWFSLPQREQVITSDPPRKPCFLASSWCVASSRRSPLGGVAGRQRRSRRARGESRRQYARRSRSWSPDR
jgi:hypothetical protein